jgi:hypothetical protein
MPVKGRCCTSRLTRKCVVCRQLHATEQLLTQIEQLRRILTLQDYDTINAELDEETRQLTQKYGISPVVPVAERR